MLFFAAVRQANRGGVKTVDIQAVMLEWCAPSIQWHAFVSSIEWKAAVRIVRYEYLRMPKLYVDFGGKGSALFQYTQLYAAKYEK